MAALPPPRPRQQSGGDIPIPEAVFGALQSLQGSVTELGKEMRAGKADTDAKIADVKKLAEDAGATRHQRIVDLVKVIAPAVALIIGGQRALAPTPPATPPPQVRQVRSDFDVKADECRALPSGSADAGLCWRRVRGEVGR